MPALDGGRRVEAAALLRQPSCISLLIVFALLFAPALTSRADEDFVDSLARVDHALKTNPSKVSAQAMQSCVARRNFAARLFDAGYTVRAKRGIKFCFDMLEIAEEGPLPGAVVEKPPTMEEIQARAKAEVERALHLKPNVENGLKIYNDCALCHMPEGWGLMNGSVPQIAGQHRNVVIKQLADIRAGHRDSVLMIPYASVEKIGGPQAVADVAAYIDTLEVSVETGKGPGTDLERGARVYAENCARCHGDRGEGDNEKFVPRIQSQHYKYLLRQFEWIREGRRRNADPDMQKQIAALGEDETRAVLDYVSRLEPPEELQAPAGWLNPDFPNWRRGP